MIAFESLPTSRRNAHRIREDIDCLTPLADTVDRFLVPEVLDGHYQTVDNVDFGAALHEATGVPVSCAVLTAPRTKSALDARVKQLQDQGLGAQFIGPSSRQEVVEGYTVLEALQQYPGSGCVAIPNRSQEEDRLHAKLRYGAGWAASQILFQAATLGVDLPVFQTIAPVVKEKDLAFITHLGADTKGVNLSNARAKAEQVYRLAEHVCVSHVMQSNVQLAVDWTLDLAESAGIASRSIVVAESVKPSIL